MNLDELVVIRHCGEVVQAVQQIRHIFRSSSCIKTSELINSFWALQDHLHRLVAILSDDPTGVFAINQKYSGLTSEVIDVVGFASKTNVGKLPAMHFSCQAIHDLLFELQNLKPTSMAASA